VDREFYVMQGEIYTRNLWHAGLRPLRTTDKNARRSAEVLRLQRRGGRADSEEHALRANVGETVRIYFGVGGPNFVSSFHVIGESWTRVYDQASLTSPP